MLAVMSEFWMQAPFSFYRKCKNWGNTIIILMLFNMWLWDKNIDNCHPKRRKHISQRDNNINTYTFRFENAFRAEKINRRARVRESPRNMQTRSPF